MDAPETTKKGTSMKATKIVGILSIVAGIVMIVAGALTWAP
ncbi:hypothetical protein [Tessaracoccus coleopterorum]|nr:hypothetical protein [Tessaracoccus coleopterorum]